MLTRLTDAITKPQIHKYAFDHVLRMPRHEFLRGCRQAALATHDALQSALHDNDTELLDELPIAPPLHRELAREVRRGWEEGEPVLSMMRSRLEEQRRCLSRGHRYLDRVHVVFRSMGCRGFRRTCHGDCTTCPVGDGRGVMGGVWCGFVECCGRWSVAMGDAACACVVQRRGRAVIGAAVGAPAAADVPLAHRLVAHLP